MLPATGAVELGAQFGGPALVLDLDPGVRGQHPLPIIFAIVSEQPSACAGSTH